MRFAAVAFFATAAAENILCEADNKFFRYPLARESPRNPRWFKKKGTMTSCDIGVRKANKNNVILDCCDWITGSMIQHRFQLEKWSVSYNLLKI